MGEAYKKAGVAFRGQLEQNFVVLHDVVEKPRNERMTQMAADVNISSPRKRPREEGEQNQNQSSKKNKHQKWGGIV